jgi:vibriolysin
VLFAQANQNFWTPSETFDTAYAGLQGAASMPDYSAQDALDVELAFEQVGVPAPPPGPVCNVVEPELSNGVSTPNFSATTGTWKCWRLDVPAEATNLFVDLRNTVKGKKKNQGDADLYIKLGSLPWVDPNVSPVPPGDYDCGSFTPESNESCSIPNADTPTVGAGSWYIAVYAWQSYPSVSLTGTYSVDTPPPSDPTITLTADEKGGRNKFVMIGWDGATTQTVRISRDGVLLPVTDNDGSYKDNGGLSGDFYQLCEVGGGSNCSADITAN